MKVREKFFINPAKNNHHFKDFINYLDTSSVKEGFLSEVDYLDSDFPSRAQRLIKYDDILYSSVRPNLRHYYHYQDNYEHAVASTGFFVIRNKNPKEYDTSFTYYYLSTNSIVNHLHTIAELSQSTFPACSYKDIGKIDLPDFDIDKQRKISSVLKNYDSLIKNNIKRIELLEKMALDIYVEWFVRFRFPGHDKFAFKLQQAKGWMFGNNENGQMIPSNWNYQELKSIAEFLRGKNITSAEMCVGEIPVISAGLEPSGYHNKFNVEGYSLTVSSSGANAGYLSYHLENVWAADCSYYNNQENIWFVYNTLKFLQPVLTNMQVGSAQPHVYPKNINRISTIIPDDETVKKYCAKVAPLYEEIKVLKNKNKVLVKQRDLLLPRLMSGKLSVEGKEVI